MSCLEPIGRTAYERGDELGGAQEGCWEGRVSLYVPREGLAWRLGRGGWAEHVPFPANVPLAPPLPKLSSLLSSLAGPGLGSESALGLEPEGLSFGIPALPSMRMRSCQLLASSSAIF